LVTFSPDGHRIVSGLTNKTIHVWDANSGMENLLPLRGHTDAVTCVAFSPNGTYIVSGSKDCTIHIWDSMSGTPMCPPLNGHERFIWSVAFSPDGSQIISNSAHNIIHKWSSSADALGVYFSKVDCITHCTSNVLDSFAVTLDGWIVDVASQTRVSKLPPMISSLSVTASAASNTSLAIATDRGSVIIMHFQPDDPLALDECGLLTDTWKL
jgi:WD40 repeat protein